MTYKEISKLLLDFIENYLKLEKIQKVSQTNNDFNKMQRELFEANEELKKLKEIDTSSEIKKIKLENEQLNKEICLLKEESFNFSEKIKEIKIFIAEKHDIDEIKLENLRMKISCLELQEVKKFSRN